MSKLIPEHRDYLAAHAVDPELATSLGVRSLTGRPDVATLGEPWQNWANFPALLFPWTGPDGRTEYQVRPDNPTEDRSGRPRKYVFRSGMVPVLWAVRPVEGAEKALIVEGTKQCLAAASYAPPGVAVFGVAGCRGWMHEGAPIPDLTVVGDLAVTVVFDVDAGGNLDVYTAGEGLAEACALFGPGGHAAGGLRPACTLPGATPTGAHPAPAPRRPTMRPARPRRAATWRPWSTGSTGSGDRSGP